MQHSSIIDDRLLALDVETALKALGIAAGDDDQRDGDLRLAVEDLRRAPRSLTRPAGLVTPTLQAADDELFVLR